MLPGTRSQSQFPGENSRAPAPSSHAPSHASSSTSTAALAFSVNYMIGIPEDQLHETERSPYMDGIGALRDGFIERTPALAETLASPVRGRLLARVNHVVDDTKAVKFLEAFPGDIAIRRTVMAAGGTHLDAFGTSNSELLLNKAWTGLTRKHYCTPCSPPLTALWGVALDAHKRVWCVVAVSILVGTTLCSATAIRGESSTRSSKTT